MKIHLVTIGKPKLAYAQTGWQEYVKRLGRFHDVRVTHLSDRYALDSVKLVQTAGGARIVALVIEGKQQFSSEELASFLQGQAQDGQELCFMIGGPDGLPDDLIEKSHYQWSFGRLTLPHDLAMVVLAEALYRASTIAAGHPYHRA